MWDPSTCTSTTNRANKKTGSKELIVPAKELTTNMYNCKDKVKNKKHDSRGI